MKELFTNTIHLLKSTITCKVYVFCFLLITASCYCNYFTTLQLWPVKGIFFHSFLFLTLLFLFFFTTGFAVAVTGYKIRFSIADKNVLVLLLAPLLFALKISLPFSDSLLQTVSPAYQVAFTKPVGWICGFLFTGLCILLLHYFFEKKWSLYFITKTKAWLPYGILLMCMIPLITMAATQADFQRMYPRAEDMQVLGSSATAIHYFVFELSYAFDFITIELFFRGLLIATMSRLLGIRCIVPVALFYFSIHLGKPMMEAISSFFGGLFLGAVSYQTKSIWGGWMVHVGIALLMELMGFLFSR